MHLPCRQLRSHPVRGKESFWPLGSSQTSQSSVKQADSDLCITHMQWTSAWFICIGKSKDDSFCSP